jgi:hypothetical protein
MENSEFEVDPDFGATVTKKKGIVLPFDDLQLGDWIAVYKIKGVEEPQPIYGQALKVTSISFPFVIGKLAADPRNPPITLDARYLDVVRVSEEYAQAQSPQSGGSPERDALSALGAILRPR